MLTRSFYRERPGHTLQTTALVHEAYLKLIDQRSARWQNRAHFFAIAAQAMRRILVDSARRHSALKRGGPAENLPLDEAANVSLEPDPIMVPLDEALTKLADSIPQQSRIVELRFFGGLTIEETAEVMKLSKDAVKNDWAMARAWLRQSLKDSSSGNGNESFTTLLATCALVSRGSAPGRPGSNEVLVEIGTRWRPYKNER